MSFMFRNKEIEKRKNRLSLHELRLGLDVISLSDDPFVLLAEKAEIIANQSVRFCEGLKIYWHGGLSEWIFDFPMTQKSASRCLADWMTRDWFVAKFRLPKGVLQK